VPVDITTRVIQPSRLDVSLTEVFDVWGAQLADALNAESPHDTGFSRWQTEPGGDEGVVFSPADYAGRMHNRGESQPFVELHAPDIVATVSAETAPKFAEVAARRIDIFGGGRG
jgi:hypothetical protein